MNERDRLLRYLRYEPVDRPPLHVVGPWSDTLARWRREGLPPDVDVHDWLGLQPLRVTNVSGTNGVWPAFETRTVEETETCWIRIDSYGRTVRDFKDHTSMPEWLDFPVKDPESFRRVLDEHFRVDDMDARFAAAWEQGVRAAAASDRPLLIDGGCYYWTLRSLAGVETASYLLYDAPDLVEELFERYEAVATEGLRRARRLTRIDLVGFGEDIAGRNGPLMSPDMFRAFILPRYRRFMERAHAAGIDLTWYDSDGDIRPLIPDYLAVGINGIAPCEVAAGMSPVELRRRFGRELRLIGGIDKREIARGPAAIDAELERVRPVIEDGGYLPAIDHSVSADISLDHYRYFIEALLRVLEIG